ncbi:hypothetical protein CV760_05840 [Bifidobacterium adolescentis]|nr:hypothetical protein CV760_05840 [Bifidobacterium adolescentis]
MGHVFFASATGFHRIESASTLVIHQNAFAHFPALFRTLAHQHLDYILLFMYGTFTCPRMYSSVYQRPPKATFTS